MTHKKQDLKQISLKELEKEIQKKEVARIDEINHIKHRCNLARINIQYNPLTYFLLFAFAIAWIYYRDFNAAVGQSSIWLLEYCLLQLWEKNKK